MSGNRIGYRVAEPPVFDSKGVVVERDHGCSARLTWRCRLPDGVDVMEVVGRLDGFCATNRTDGLLILDHGDGCRLVVVPRTGRIQLRLGFLTAFDDRAPHARDFGRRILAVVEGWRVLDDPHQASRKRRA